MNECNNDTKECKVPPLLECKDINYCYHTLSGETPTLSNISFQVFPGQFIAIVGPSGCGKSTLLSLINGLLTPDCGAILYNGKPMQDQSNHPLGFMPQRDQLFEWRTIEKNILLGLEIQHKITPEALEYAGYLLEQYGLKDFAHKKPSELSGGMRQRAALIRTLVLKPTLLLLDEPFSALDYQTRLHVGNDIGQIIRKEGKTAILVTHDLSEAISLADKVLVLTNRPGRVKEYITTSSDEYLTPLEKRNSPDFKTYFKHVWEVFEQNDPTI